MSLPLAFHDFIQKYNVLAEPTKVVNRYLRDNPRQYKVALVINHLFRAVAMATFLAMCPFPLLVSGSICLTGSLFYRLTVETNCAYKFALPSFVGGLAFHLSGLALKHFSSWAAIACTSVSIGIYFTYVILTVSYDVDC
jgi:hypothetical protein